MKCKEKTKTDGSISSRFKEISKNLSNEKTNHLTFVADPSPLCLLLSNEGVRNARQERQRAPQDLQSRPVKVNTLLIRLSRLRELVQLLTQPNLVLFLFILFHFFIYHFFSLHHLLLPIHFNIPSNYSPPPPPSHLPVTHLSTLPVVKPTPPIITTLVEAATCTALITNDAEQLSVPSRQVHC